MEEPREPQQPTGPIAYPAMYTTQPTQYYVPAPPARPSGWARMRRTMRLLLRRLLRGAFVTGRVLRPFAGMIVVALVLLSVIGWMGFQLWGPKADAPAFQRADSIPPASSIESFMQGQKDSNADMMWDAYSPEYQSSQLSSGSSKSTLQALANDRRSKGVQYVKYNYIGGVPVDGGSMYFYAVDLAVQNEHLNLPIIFHADADGKITDIDSPLYPAVQTTTKQQ